jgi:hypothetical protein
MFPQHAPPPSNDIRLGIVGCMPYLHHFTVGISSGTTFVPTTTQPNIEMMCLLYKETSPSTWVIQEMASTCSRIERAIVFICVEKVTIVDIIQIVVVTLFHGEWSS